MKLSSVIFLLSLSLASSYKILSVFPFASKSHYAIGEATMRALVEAGHEVTMMSVFELSKPMPNYKQIKLPNLLDKMLLEQPKYNAFEVAKMSPLMSLFYLFNLGKDQAELFFQSDEVQRLMKSNEKFDAIFVELFAIDSLIGFGQHFNCPVIGVNTFDAIYWNDIYTSNQSPFSYVPNVFLGLPDEMNFSQRLYNTIFSHVEHLLYNFYHLPKQRKIYDKYFPNAKMPFFEAHKSLSLVFMNSHVSMSSARPLMPNMIGINGIHVKPASPLPEDIKTYLDTAKDGVILFSMGSFVQSTDWTTEQRQAFVSAFGKLKQRVLWKYENETLPGNPGNIKIGSWIPQRDIVSHPNVKLFITHGGNLGTTEAMSEGVALLGIPLYGDQMMNLKRAVAKGYALTLDFTNLTEENISEAINEMLTNPKYSTNAKRLSSLFKDRPLDPKQTVVYWTEHVIRQEGAHHLKASGRNMGFIEFYLIDVYSTLAVGFFGLFYIAFFSFIVIRKLFKKTPTSKQKKQ